MGAASAHLPQSRQLGGRRQREQVHRGRRAEAVLVGVEDEGEGEARVRDDAEEAGRHATSRQLVACLPKGGGAGG